MSLLDDNLDIDTGALLMNSFKKIMFGDKEGYKSDKSLFETFRNSINYNYWIGQDPEGFFENLDMKIIAPKDLPDNFLIGYDRLKTDVINKLTIKLFDPDKIVVTQDHVFYEDDKGKYVYKFNTKSYCGYFGCYRLDTQTVNVDGKDRRIGSLIVNLDELVNGNIDNRFYLGIPNTSMEVHWEFCRQQKEHDNKLPIYKHFLNTKAPWEYLI